MKNFILQLEGGMKSKSTFLFLLALLVSTGAYCQTFTGPSDVCYNQNYTYTYSDDVTYTSVTWTFTGGGSIVSGTGLSRVLKWTSDGTVTVKLFNGSTVVSQDTKTVVLFTPGTISGLTQVCQGSSVTITKIGQTGVYVWELSTNGGTTWTGLGSATSLVHTPTAASNKYRLRLSECTRGNNLSNVIATTVSPPTNAGTLSITSASTFCSSGSVALSLANSVGTITWQSRNKNGAGSWTSWANISGSGATNSYSVTQATGMDKTYEFRASVQSGACSAIIGNTVTAIVNPASSAGTITISAPSYCSSGTVNLGFSTAAVGSISWQWRKKDGPGGTWTSWATFATGTTTASYNVTVGSTLDRYYEFQVSAVSGICSAATGNTVTTTVYKPSSAGFLSITGASAFCATGTVSLSLGLAPMGTFTWQSRQKDGAGAWSSWTTFSVGTATTNTYAVSTSASADRTYEFRVSAQNGICVVETGNSVSATVNRASSAGTLTLSGSSTFCDSGTASLGFSVAPVGTISWQYRKKDGTSSWGSWTTFDTGTATTNTYNVTSLSSMDRFYEFRASVTNGACSAVIGNTVSATVNPDSDAGTIFINGASSFCQSGNVSLLLSGSPIGTFSWQSRQKDGTGSWTSWSTFSTGTVNSNSYTVSCSASLDRTYEFRVSADNGVCPADIGNSVSVLVSPPSIAGTLVLTSAGAFCGSGTVSLGFSSTPRGSISWQYRKQDGTGSWSSWSTFASGTSTTTYTVSSTATMDRNYEFRASIQSGACSAEVTNTITSIVNPASSPGTLIITDAIDTFCQSGTVYLGFSTATVGTISWLVRYKDGEAGEFTSWSTFATTTIQTNSYNVSGTSTVNRIYEFSASVQSGVCGPVPGNSVSVTINPTPTIDNLQIAEGTFFYGDAGPLNLSVAASMGTLGFEYSTNGTTWLASSNPTTVFTVSTMLRGVATSGICAPAYTPTVNINVFPSPVALINGPDAITIGTSTEVFVQNSFTSYQWIKNDVDIPGATGTTLAVNEPAKYKVKVKGSVSAPWKESLPVTINSTLLAQPQAINYKVVTSIFKSGFTETSNFYTLNAEEVNQSVTYMDGYGRTVQTVGIGQTPGRKDVVMPYVYDYAGRSEYQYPGYTTDLLDGRFRPYAIKTSSGNFNGSELENYYDNTDFTATDSDPYSRTVFESSPLGRVLEQGAIGSDWQPGTGHTVRQTFNVNNSAHTDAALKNIVMWTASGPGSNYADDQLAIATTTDENWNKVWTFTDKMGRTVLKRSQLDETVEGMTTPFLETYYVYDLRGNLALQIPPKAVAKLNNGTSWSTAFRNEWCFVYTYDERNRLVEKKTPDAAAMYYAYDPLDRLVLVQDANLRTSNKWMFIKYDIKDRTVMTGLYQNNTHNTRTEIQEEVLDVLYDPEDPGFWYEEKGSTLHGHTNQSFPTQNSSGSALEVLSVNYYDNYDFDNNGTDDYSYTSQGLSGDLPQFRAFDLPTGSKRIVVGSTTWLYSYVFYDKYGRVSQVRSNNHLSTAIDNLSTNVYNFSGTLKYSKNTHKGSGGTVVTTQQRPVYDHAGRVQKLFQSINGGSEQEVAAYAYNELGQLIDKKLHNTGGTNYLQSVDYRYNIRGWLKSINNAQLTTGSNNDDTGDYFGMELSYNTSESGMGNTLYFNGKISAIKWKGPGASTGSVGQRSYKYAYDKTDKLKAATFQAYGITAWDQEANTLNETMGYDANGNILNLDRNKNARGLSGINVTSAAEAIDELTYTYGTGTGNRLKKVEDAQEDEGFKNGTTATTEYTYDANGSLTQDLNKGISSITYNFLGKPQQVNFSDGRTIDYVYDASGTKLTMSVTQSGNTTTTDYADAFVYTNGSLSFFGSPEGRIMKNGGNYEYEYSIADHQGNTRVVFSAVTPAPTSKTATFEGDAGDNVDEFTNIDVNMVVPSGSANHTPAGLGVIRMNQTYKVGPAKSVNVYPGDKIDLEVWEYHEGNSGYGTIGTPLNSLITMIAGAFGGASGGGGESGLIYDGINAALGTFATGGNQGDTRPAAYLNYILFDKDYKVLDAGWQLAPDVAFTKQKISFPQKTIKEAGYIYAWLSYDDDSNNYVYFDDFKVTHTKSNIVQYNEYYPFGLQTASSWTRDGSKNDYNFNGGSELNKSTSNYELLFREYDPALGRMNAVDPMTDKYGSLTPYNYAFSDPVFWNDPMGADPDQDFNNLNATAGGNMQYLDASNGMYGSAFERYGVGDAFRTYYGALREDAAAVRSGQIGIGDYAAKYGIAPQITDYFTNGDRERYIDSKADFYDNGKLVLSVNFYDPSQQYSWSSTWGAHFDALKNRDRIPDWVPVLGAIESSVQAANRGDYTAAVGNFVLAISDFALARSIYKGVTKGGVALLGKSYKYWKSTRSFLGREGFAKAGQQVHHWAWRRNGAVKGEGFAWWAKNQMWNLMPMSSGALHTAVHGLGRNALGPIGQFWYGTPTWLKAGIVSGVGHSLE